MAPILDAVVRHNRALRADDPRPADPGLLNEALHRVPRLLPHDGLLVLVSDAFGADERSVDLVTRITAHNDALFTRFLGADAAGDA